MAKTPQRITADLDQLYPGDTIQIGDQTLVIQPLSSLELSIVIKKLKALVKSLEEDGVTWDNYNDPDCLLKIAVKIMEDFPDMLAEASNIHVEDLKSLPIELIVQILDKVVEVNMASKDSLVGNFDGLMKKLGMEKKQDQKTPPEQTPKKASRRQSRN